MNGPMRSFRIGPGAAALLIAALACCAHSPSAPPSASTANSPTAHSVAVNPAHIKRIVGDLPPGYEVTTGVPDDVSPRTIWNLPADAAAVESAPAQCAALADPGNGRGRSAQGVSASGTGGIIRAVVVALPGPAQLDHNVVEQCPRWSMNSGHTTASVQLTDAPHVNDADTVGMLAETKSSVESGTEIDSRTYTFVAYLGNYYAFTTLTTDPGSALPALPPKFAADLLVKTVSALRG
ncbi:hypothetical protein BN971_01313 [Mycobacterium bohemicum DSM 44277]|nr:hypothetical protein BN971_01313 [Mycobacterium bohemicum DSM 44277]